MISQDDFESTKKKLASFKGVKGVIVTSSEGLPISSTIEMEKTEKVAALITSLVKKTAAVVEALGEESFNFLILDTQKGSNIMVAPEEEQILIVLKDSDPKIQKV